MMMIIIDSYVDTYLIRVIEESTKKHKAPAGAGESQQNRRRCVGGGEVRGKRLGGASPNQMSLRLKGRKGKAVDQTTQTLLLRIDGICLFACA